MTALIRGDRLILSWLGDSQAVLVKVGKAVTDMEPHKPDRQVTLLFYIDLVKMFKASLPLKVQSCL